MSLRWKNYWRELLCLLLLLLFIPITYCWVRFDGVKNMELGSIILIAALADAVLFVRTFRRLWREKWKRTTAQVLQKVFARIMRGLSTTFEKWGYTQKRANVIGGRTSIMFDRFLTDSEMKRPTVRRLRWKQLPDSRARLGYLYRHMIKKRIEQGSEYYSSDTPMQLQKRGENTPIEDELFSLYIQKRYDARTEPDEDTLLRIKDEMQIK